MVLAFSVHHQTMSKLPASFKVMRCGWLAVSLAVAWSSYSLCQLSSYSSVTSG